MSNDKLRTIGANDFNIEPVKVIDDLKNATSIPYTNSYYDRDESKEDKVSRAITKELYDYMSGKYSLTDVNEQIKNKTCTLSRRCRDYVSEMFK